MENTTKLASYYKHIDNGGIMIDIEQSNNEYKNIFIKMSTTYHGYPDVSSQLSLWAHGNDKETLTKIGMAFLEAANKIN